MVVICRVTGLLPRGEAFTFAMNTTTFTPYFVEVKKVGPNGFKPGNESRTRILFQVCRRVDLSAEAFDKQIMSRVNPAILLDVAQFLATSGLKTINESNIIISGEVPHESQEK